MSNIYSIYKAVNIFNGKCYIGYDSRWPKRQSDHQKANRQCKFHHAIRKYGWNNFEWEVIYQSIDQHHCLKEMEPYFIQQYDSFHNGYNMTLGGEGSSGYFHSKETRQKMSAAKKGKSNPHHSLIMKGRTNPKTSEKLRGRKLSLEHIRKATKPKKYYKVTNPDGISYIILGLKQFCLENQLHYSCMLNVSRNHYTNHKGWICSLIA